MTRSLQLSRPLWRQQVSKPVADIWRQSVRKLDIKFNDEISTFRRIFGIWKAFSADFPHCSRMNYGVACLELNCPTTERWYFHSAAN